MAAVSAQLPFPAACRAAPFPIAVPDQKDVHLPMPHQFDIRIYYEDTDLAGIVYYANYLRYIERARSDWVREIGIDQNEMRRLGQVFAVRQVTADYISPAHFDDMLQVDTSIEQLSPARLVLSQSISRGETEIFKASVTIVCLSETGRPTRLPAIFRQLSG